MLVEQMQFSCVFVLKAFLCFLCKYVHAIDNENDLACKVNVFHVFPVFQVLTHLARLVIYIFIVFPNYNLDPPHAEGGSHVRARAHLLDERQGGERGGAQTYRFPGFSGHLCYFCSIYGFNVGKPCTPKSLHNGWEADDVQSTSAIYMLALSCRRSKDKNYSDRNVKNCQHVKHIMSRVNERMNNYNQTGY